MKQHTYEVQIDWTGNEGVGTRSYTAYRRDYTIAAAGKPQLQGSSDPAFRGDAARYNPEELLVASLSACHMLWYLHLCSTHRITVLEYVDAASGVMEESADGLGAFVRVVLKPTVKIADGEDQTKALGLHTEAHGFCYIARSVKFPVELAPEVS